MDSVDPELVIDPAALEQRLEGGDFRIIDLSDPRTYAEGHVPGAIQLDYAALNRRQPPVMGLLPEPDDLRRLFARLGIGPETHVIAYDNEGGGKAARLCWTLDASGHYRYSLLDGGRQAWARENHPLETTRRAAEPAQAEIAYNERAVADRDYIIAGLGRPGLALLDCRSPGEFQGQDRRAARAGHIPGAVNMEWSEALDAERNPRLKPKQALLDRLQALNVDRDQEVITYCQTHHRSSHTWLILKYLGFTRVRGYPGSWSEWGNEPALPIEPADDT